MSASRREFLAAGAAFTAARAMGANDKINVAVIGVGGRGTDHVKTYITLPDARVAAVCDVDQTALERASALVHKETGHKPKEYKDMRQAFDDKNIQAVSMPSQPLACAGHHLGLPGRQRRLLEKPACHNLYEGRA